MKKLWLPLALATAGLAASAGAQQSGVHTASIRLDPQRTEIGFTAGMFRRVHGTFALKNGLFALDTATGVAQGEVLVDAQSEKSNNHGMDTRIQNGTLEAGRFPGIEFHPEKVTGSLPAPNGETHLQVQGQLTVHGQDHEVTLDVDATRTGDDLVLKTAFTVPYVQWGMKEVRSFFMHDRDVHITVVAHGSLGAKQA